MLIRPTQLRPLFLFPFCAALAFAVVMALLPSPPQPLGNMYDKYQHMLAFGTLSLLATLAFPQVRLAQIGERLSFLGALIEVGQSIPALHRDCDIFDWVADTAAVIVVLVIVGVLTRKRVNEVTT